MTTIRDQVLAAISVSSDHRDIKRHVLRRPDSAAKNTNDIEIELMN